MTEEEKHIIIKSGKNTITSVSDMVEINAAKDIHLSSKTGLKIDLGTTEKPNNIIADSTNIVLGLKQNSGETIESIAKGESLEVALNAILDMVCNMADHLYVSAEGTDKEDMKQLRDDTKGKCDNIKKYLIPKVKSERNKTI